MTANATANLDHDIRSLRALIADHGSAAYDDIRHQHPTADPVKVAALVEDVQSFLVQAREIEEDPAMVLVHTDFTVYTHSSAEEIAAEKRWEADDAIAAFLKEVA